MTPAVGAVRHSKAPMRAELNEAISGNDVAGFPSGFVPEVTVATDPVLVKLTLMCFPIRVIHLGCCTILVGPGESILALHRAEPPRAKLDESIASLEASLRLLVGLGAGRARSSPFLPLIWICFERRTRNHRTAPLLLAPLLL